MAGAGGVLLWLVVSFLCDVVCGADFRGIGCRRVRGGGHWGGLVCGGVGVMGVGGGAILSWWICGKHIIN